jgi:hypothetical protein
MNLSLKGGSSLLALLALTACAAKHPHATINATVPVSCVHAIRMIDCSPDLLRCKKVQLDHDKGCEEIEVRQ